MYSDSIEIYLIILWIVSCNQCPWMVPAGQKMESGLKTYTVPIDFSATLLSNDEILKSFCHSFQTAIPVLIGTKFDEFVQLPLDLQWTIASEVRFLSL